AGLGDMEVARDRTERECRPGPADRQDLAAGERLALARHVAGEVAGDRLGLDPEPGAADDDDVAADGPDREGPVAGKRGVESEIAGGRAEVQPPNRRHADADVARHRLRPEVDRRLTLELDLARDRL